ncbi:hypothetical protein ECC02_012873 [Trypanosoma cruzi]|uniref:Uncharacterized protein n=1 Tax=Trypanosoma cruzi TaxID=5693 RepID=A0A7J6XJW2_TRYCR|nr:hypothetical protein ECC02_012873 [Trypanosoma cruzi]
MHHRVHLIAVKQHLEEMRLYKCEINGVALHKLQILLRRPNGVQSCLTALGKTPPVAHRVKRRCKKTRIPQQRLSAHVTIRHCCRHITPHILKRQHITVPNDRNGPAQVLTYTPYLFHVRKPSLVVPRSAMHAKDRNAGVAQHLRVLQRQGVVVKHTHFRRHRHPQLDCEAVQDVVHTIPVLHEKRAVVATAGDALRTAKVDINCLAVVLHVTRRGEKRVGVIPAKLHKKRMVCFFSITRSPGIFCCFPFS